MKKVLIFTGIFVLVLIVFRNIFQPVVLSGGDYIHFWPENIRYIQNLSFYSWDSTVNLGYNTLGILHFAPYNFLAGWLGAIVNFNPVIWERVAWWLPFFFFSILSPMLLVRYVFRKSLLLFFFSPLVFLFNTYIITLISGGQVSGIGLAYSIAPLVLLGFIKTLQSSIASEENFQFSIFNFSLKGLGSLPAASNFKILKFSIIAGLLFSAQVMFDLRIAYITLVAVLLYCVMSICLTFSLHKVQNTIYKILYTLAVPLGITGLLHLFWILPTVLFHVNTIQQLGAAYDSINAVKFFSFATLENSLGLLHPNWPDNIFGKVYFMRPEFIVLPILAFSSLMFINRKQEVKNEEQKMENLHILFAGLLGLVGAFLAKGANDPFGGVYLWMFNHIPGFIMFRDPTKWYLLVAISYSILIPFSIKEIYLWLQSRKKVSIKSKFFNLQNIYLLLVTCYLLVLIRPAFLGQLGGVFQTVPIPPEYVHLKNFLTSQQDFSRTLWVPSTQRFKFTSDKHPAVIAEDLFHTISIPSTVTQLQKNDTMQLLQNAGIKYVIIPDDSEKEMFITDRRYDPKLYNQTVASVSAISWLTRVNGFGRIAVFKVPNPQRHFYIVPLLMHPWEMSTASVDSIQTINPTTYKITVNNVEAGDQLVFSESFDRNWNLILQDGKTLPASPYENMFNSFILPEAGDYTVTVLYKPQQVINKGLLISLLATVVCLLLIAVLSFTAKKGKEVTRRKLFPTLDQEVSPAYQTQFAVTKPYIQNKVVLDVGCWSGQLAQLLITDAKKVKGIDPGKEAIALAKKKVPQGEFVIGRAEQLPYQSHSCDVVICFEVIEHLPKGNEPLALQEMYRVLKPGGYLLLSTPHKNITSILFDPAFFLLGHRHYSYEELKTLLEETGFTVEKTFRKFGFYTEIALNISLLAKHILRKKITFPSFIEKKQIEEGEKEGFFSIYIIAKKI